MKLNPLAFGYSASIISSITMLLLGILGNFGIYGGMVKMMGEAHIFFSLTVIGIIGGIIEAAIISFVLTYMFALIYNKLD